MNYVMSDLHGCLKEYRQALRAIRFSDADTLYVLGDVIDRGPDSVGLLRDMMLRPNVIPLIGNHEYMALRVLRRLCVEITAETAEHYLRPDDLTAYAHWCADGGDKTAAQFRALPRKEQEELLDYLEEFSLYETVRAGGRDYVLVHAGLEPFVPDRPLEDYHLAEMIFRSPDYDRVYFPNRVLVTGHTPTAALGAAHRGKIVQQNNHIAIDCGCVFGMALGVYCLDTGETWYIPAQTAEK